MAGAAAVVGRGVPHALLAGVVAEPEEDVVAAFEALCHARLLEDHLTAVGQDKGRHVMVETIE